MRKALQNRWFPARKRRSKAAAFLLSLALASTTALARLPEGYETFYLERQASPDVWEAAGELAELMERQFGEKPDLRPVPLFGPGYGLLIGPRPEHEAFDANALTDEILIARGSGGLRIHGSDNPSTVFAVYRFASDFLGWYRFQPGPLGLERADAPPVLPRSRGQKEILLRETSDWYSRNPSVGGLPEERNWAHWQGLRERFRYSHTLHKAVPPLLFDTHPEWFAKDADGRPMRPPFYPKVHGYNDHPDLTHPAVREQAAMVGLHSLAQRTAIRFQESPSPQPWWPELPVREAPGSVSISVGLGDSFVFGEALRNHPLAPTGYFRRWPDWSPLVFDYSNAVAARIAAAWQAADWPNGSKPDLYLGVLAYLTWENVPPMSLDPHLLPYLTFDRSQWYDSLARADDLANVASWHLTEAPFLGTWDYLFGYGFLIPRSMSTIVSDSIPALHERGVRAYYSQVLPLWPFDGHTTWLTARLLWDVEASPDHLLETYFTEYFGPAAENMKAFFARAEARWMEQEGDGWWLRYWKDPWQMALWPDAFLTSQASLLDQALAACHSLSAMGQDTLLPSVRFRNRVEKVADLFTLTREMHHYQKQVWDLQTTDWSEVPEKALEQGLHRAEESLHLRKVIERRFHTLQQELSTRHLGDLDWAFLYDTLGGSLAAQRVRAQQLDPAGQHLRALADRLLARWAAVASPGGPAPAPARKPREILYDNRFAEVENPRIWHQQFMDSANQSLQERSEASSFVVENVRRGHLYQLFPAAPAESFLGTVEVETLQSPTGEVYLRLDFFNADHEKLSQSPRARIAPTHSHGVSQSIPVFATAPEEAAYGRLFIRFYELDADVPVRVSHPRVYRIGHSRGDQSR